MNLFHVIILGIVFFISLIFVKEKYNPVTLFSGFWLLIFIFSSMELYNIEMASTRVYSIVTTGVVAFSVGALLASGVRPKFKVGRKTHSSNSDLKNVNYKIVFPITVLTTLIFTICLARVVAIMLQGTTLNYIRSNFSTLVVHNEIERLAWTFIFYPLGISIMPVGLYAYLVDRRSIYYFWMSLANTILLSICSGGRVFLMYYMIQFVFFTVVTKRQVRQKSRMFRNFAIIAIGAICIGMMLFISNERQIKTSPIEGLYSYFTGCLPYFDFQLGMGNVEYGYGMYFLYAPITLGLMILKNIGILSSYPANYLNVQETINSFQTYTRIGNNWFNAFTTCFNYFYLDAGIVGVICGSGIYGFISYIIFKKIKSQTRSIILYSIILITIFISMVRWQFARPEFFMAVIYIVLFTMSKKKEVQNEYRIK